MSTASIFIAGFDIIKYEKKSFNISNASFFKEQMGGHWEQTVCAVCVCVFMLLAS